MRHDHIHKLMFALVESPKLVMNATGVDYIELGEGKYGLAPLFLDLDSYLEKLRERKSFTFEFEFADHKATELQYRILESLSEETLKMKAKETRFDGNNYVLSTPNVLSSYLSNEESLFWARKAGWSTVEATFLSLGLIYSEKFLELWDKVNNRFSYHRKLFPLLASLAERKILIESAVTYGKIKNGSPTDYLDWFQKMRFSFPDRLRQLTNEIQGEVETEDNISSTDQKNAQISPRKLSSLLTLIHAMGSYKGIKYDVDDTRNGAVKRIEQLILDQGLKLSERTIRDTMKEASEEAERLRDKNN